MTENICPTCRRIIIPEGEQWNGMENEILAYYDYRIKTLQSMMETVRNRK